MSYMPKSKSDTHLTPDRVYDTIWCMWGVSKERLFDPCPENPKSDGLKIPWKKYNYVNPPYTLLTEFVQKTHEESFKGKTSFLLLPSKTDQQWFHDYIIPRINDVYWFRKRLKFKNNKHHATQPHFLVKFG